MFYIVIFTFNVIECYNKDVDASVFYFRNTYTELVLLKQKVQVLFYLV